MPGVSLMKEQQWKTPANSHATVTINQSCTTLCMWCNYSERLLQKSLQTIKYEIDLLIRQRTVESITITGYEPLAHEKLPEIITYIRSKKIRPILFTNGHGLGSSLLYKCKVSGIKRINLHIDRQQQGRPDTNIIEWECMLNPLRRRYIEKCSRFGITTAVALSLKNNTITECNEVVKFAMKNPNVTSLMINDLSIPDSAATEPDTPPKTISNVVSHIEKTLQMVPLYMYSDTNLNDKTKWNIYISAITTSNNDRVHSLHLHPRYRFTKKILRNRFEKKCSFDVSLTTSQALILLCIYTLLSLNPIIMVRTFILLIRAIKNRNFRFFPTIIQQPRDPIITDSRSCINCIEAVLKNKQEISLQNDRKNPNETHLYSRQFVSIN